MAPLSHSMVDRLLTAQLAVAWAGERGEVPRLGWWRTDLKSEFGGEDFFTRLLPKTWEWAVFQAMREAARRADAQLRERDGEPDRFVSLFYFGFEVDERVEERLHDLKDSGVSPYESLPGLREVVTQDWDQQGFVEWVEGHGSSDFTAAPAGRRLKGKQPDSIELATARLVAALLPLSETYPMPHFRGIA